MEKGRLLIRRKANQNFIFNQYFQSYLILEFLKHYYYVRQYDICCYHCLVNDPKLRYILKFSTENFRRLSPKERKNVQLRTKPKFFKIAKCTQNMPKYRRKLYKYEFFLLLRLQEYIKICLVELVLVDCILHESQKYDRQESIVKIWRNQK